VAPHPRGSRGLSSPETTAGGMGRRLTPFEGDVTPVGR
jgi:hypothetical protein